MEVLLYTILTLCVLGVLAAIVLYFVARKFRVEEDPRIDVVEKMLPGANCGGCGFAGCRGMADALVKREDISELFCPEGLAEAARQSMAKAHYLARGLAAIEGVTLRYSGEFFHEFVTDLPKQDEILAALEQADILGGLPLEGGILWCATEKVPREALDRTIAIVKEVLSK